MKQIRIFIPIFTWLILIAASVMTGTEIEVKPEEDHVIVTAPGHIASIELRIVNNSYRAYEMIADVQLPEGWELITHWFPFTVGEGEIQVRPLSFMVSGVAVPGKYTVICHVQSREFPSIHDYIHVTVYVEPRIPLLHESGKDETKSAVFPSDSLIIMDTRRDTLP